MGTVAIDGRHAPDLHSLLSRNPDAKGYFPVGIRVGSDNPRSSTSFAVTIFAVDTSVVGNDATKIGAYADAQGKLPVFEFSIDVPIADLLSMLNRLDMVVFSRYLAKDDLDIEVLPDN